MMNDILDQNMDIKLNEEMLEAFKIQVSNTILVKSSNYNDNPFN